MADCLEAWMRPGRARFLLLIVAIACFLLRRPWGLNEVSKEEAQAHYKVLSSTSARSAATGQRGGLREASTATTTLEAEPPISEVEDTGPTPAPTPVLRTYPDDPIMEQTWAEVNYNLTNAPTSMPATGLKYVKCRDHYKAFGGAWLAARSLVDKTSFPPHRDPEWSMHYMYGAHQHHGRKSLKTLDYRHFFVEHFTGLVHHIKEMDLESHPWATSMVRQRAQEAAALCDNLHWSPPFEHPHGDDEVAVVTFFWMKDQQEAFESNPHFYEIRSNYYRGTICAANRYFKTFKVFYCAERWPRSHFNGSDDGAIAESLLSARKTLRPGSTIEYIPVKCQADHYFPLIYAALGKTKELIKGDDAWPEQLKYILFTEPDQRVEIDQATAKENFDILDDTYYLSPHRLEELFVGKQVDGTFPQYRFDGRLFDTFNWCECKAWADSERFCLDYVGQHNG